jgi:hypothetical protein
MEYRARTCTAEESRQGLLKCPTVANRVIDNFLVDANAKLEVLRNTLPPTLSMKPSL